MRSIAAIATLLLVPVAGSAHHSQTFFSDEIAEFTGELVDLAWRNPHVVVTVAVDDDASGSDTWRFEIDSTYVLGRTGVNREHFPVGERVRVAGYPSNVRTGEALGTNLLLPDGREVLLHGRGYPLWTDDVVGRVVGMVPENEVVANAVEENRGLYRVWSNPWPVSREMRLPFTDGAIAARAEFDLADNFATRCEPEGLPRLMRNPHPFEFMEGDSEILIRSELYDLIRTIRMDEDSIPPNAAASPLGYSVGAWDGNTLVVTTAHINWPYFDNVGTPQSEAVEIVERYTLTPDQTRLDYHMTITDPATFTEPGTIAGHWLALGEEIEPFECAVN